jgi:hypothetical protein
MVRLVHPAGSGKQVEVLGHGAGAAPAVVEMLSQLGLLVRAREARSVAR